MLYTGVCLLTLYRPFARARLSLWEVASVLLKNTLQKLLTWQNRTLLPHRPPTLTHRRTTGDSLVTTAYSLRGSRCPVLPCWPVASNRERKENVVRDP